MLGDMTIQRMDNVAIVVDDLDAAVAFFTELGMELEGKGQIEGLWADRTVGLDGVRSDIAMMRTPDGHSKLELAKYHTPAAVGAGPEGAGACKRACDPALAVVSLLLVVGEQCGRRRIRARCAREDAIYVAAPRIDCDGDAGEPGEELLGVWLGQERDHLGPLRQRQRLVVAGDGHVEQGLEDPEL